MSSHRAARTDRRDSGHRRIAVATTASAVGGTALAVLFGTVLAQGTTPAAPAAATLVDAAAKLAPAAVSAPDTAGQPTTEAPAPAHPTAVKSHRSTPTTTALRPPPSAPTKAPEATAETKAPEPTHASTGAS